jgi:hypothetical protein
MRRWHYGRETIRGSISTWESGIFGWWRIYLVQLLLRQDQLHLKIRLPVGRIKHRERWWERLHARRFWFEYLCIFYTIDRTCVLSPRPLPLDTCSSLMPDLFVLSFRVPPSWAPSVQLIMNNWWVSPNVSGLHKSGWITEVKEPYLHMYWEAVK